MSTLFKKVTSAISVGAILASTVGTSIVAASSEFLPYAEALAEANIINKQSSEAGYRLADNIVRQEVAKVMLALNKATYAEDFSCAGKFSDVSATKPNDWACKVVETALSKGLISANAKFRPEDNITRAEALKMILKGQGVEIATGATSSFNDVTEGWQVDATETALAKKYISANASFRPNANITRGELFKMAANAAGLEIASDDLDLEDLFGDDEDEGTGSTSTGSTGSTSTGVQLVGDVTLALNPASPASQSIPQVGTVTFGKYDVKAGSADVTLNSINLVREGLGNRTDFSRVWFEKDGIRVTGRQSIGSDGTVSVTFSPALVVKAGATESVDLVASLSGSSTGGQHKFTILGDASVVSSAKVGGTFPLSTATMTTANYTVVPVTFSTGGSVSTYKVGDKSVELGQFKLYNGSQDDKSATFKSITLRNDGSGDMTKNLANLAVYKNNVKVSSGVIFDSKKVTFAINDSLAFGRTETYYVRGDIDTVSNTSGDDYTLTLQNTDDINVVETVTGFKATISGAAAMAKYSVTGGDIIFSKSTGVVSSQTIAPGANDVVLLAGDLKVAQAVNLQNLSLGFESNSGITNQFSQLKLKIGNSVVATFTPSSSNTATGTINYTSANAIKFDGTFTVSANTTLQVLGNVKSTALSSTFKITDFGIGNFEIKEYVSNGNTVQSEQIAGTVAGVSSNIGKAAITVTRNDGIANQKLASGSQGVTVLAYDMKASDVSDVTVTKLKFDVNSTTATSASKVDALNGNGVATVTGVVSYVDTNGVIYTGNAVFTGAQASSTGNVLPTLTVADGAIAAYNGTVTTAGGGTGTLSITAMSASKIANSSISSAMLYVNNTLVSTKSMTSGSADFNDISFVIPKNGVAGVKLVLNFSTAVNQYQYFNAKLSQVDARDTNSITIDNSLITKPTGVYYTFITAGTAKIANAANNVSSSIVSPTTASGGVLLSRITLTAQDDDLQLTDIYLKQALSDGTQLSDLGARAKFYLYDNANINFAAPLAVGTATADTIAFNIGNNSTFIVPKNNTSGVTLAVYAVFNDVVNSADSGKLIKLTLGYNSSNTTPVTGTIDTGANAGLRLVSKSTTSTLVGSNVISNTYSSDSHLLSRAKPTIAAGAASLSTHAFTVTASNNDLQLTTADIKYSLSYSGAAGTFELFKDQDSNTSNLVATGSISASGVVAADGLNTVVQIAKGETKTFYFHVSTQLQSGQAVNTKRIFKITDFGYNDMLDDTIKAISSVKNYSNVGIPTIESTFTY